MPFSKSKVSYTSTCHPVVGKRMEQFLLHADYGQSSSHSEGSVCSSQR